MIVTLTASPALDATFAVDRVEPGVKLRLELERRDPGGGGINVARAVLELGGAPMAVFAAGGSNGDELDRLLEQAGIDRRRVRIRGSTRENMVAVERETRRQFRFSLPNATLSSSERGACLDALAETLREEGDVLVVSGSLPAKVPVAFYAEAVKLASDRGCRVVGDSSGEALAAIASAGVHLLKPNRRELAALAGRAVEGTDAVVDAARELVDRGAASVVVVSMGPAGACLVSGSGSMRAPSPDVEVESAIGAGDSMVGAMALAIARSRPCRDVLAWGVAAGAAAVTTPGTQLLHRDDFERLLDRVHVTELASHA